MKRSQLNAGLLVLSLGLAAAVFFSQDKEKPGAPLTALTAAAVTSIALEHPGRPAVKLQKDGSQWKLVEPVQGEADPLEINGILALATLETKSTLELAQVNLAELGLEPPAYKITLNDQVLEFGGTEPLQYQRYVKAAGKIALVDDPPANALDADYSDLVGKTLLPANAEISAIQLPGLKIARSADGKDWALTPDDPKASADQKQKLVDGWKNARAMWNAADAPEGSPGDTVTITLKDRELKFIVAERDPQLVLVNPALKVRFTLSKALVDELLKLPAETPPPAEPAKPAETAQ